MNAAEQLATLRRMTADLPWRPDRRSQEELDHDASLEQAAEERKHARMTPTGPLDAAWLAARGERWGA